MFTRCNPSKSGKARKQNCKLSNGGRQTYLDNYALSTDMRFLWEAHFLFRITSGQRIKDRAKDQRNVEKENS